MHQYIQNSSNLIGENVIHLWIHLKNNNSPIAMVGMQLSARDKDFETLINNGKTNILMVFESNFE